MGGIRKFYRLSKQKLHWTKLERYRVIQGCGDERGQNAVLLKLCWNKGAGTFLRVGDEGIIGRLWLQIGVTQRKSKLLHIFRIEVVLQLGARCLWRLGSSFTTETGTLAAGVIFFNDCISKGSFPGVWESGHKSWQESFWKVDISKGQRNNLPLQVLLK